MGDGVLLSNSLNRLASSFIVTLLKRMLWLRSARAEKQQLPEFNEVFVRVSVRI
jgi:hypothetical protein